MHCPCCDIGFPTKLKFQINIESRAKYWVFISCLFLYYEKTWVLKQFLSSFYSPWHRGNRRRQRAYKQLRSSWAACKSFNIIQSRKYSLEEIKLFKLSRQQWAQTSTSLITICSYYSECSRPGPVNVEWLQANYSNIFLFTLVMITNHFTPQQHSQSPPTVAFSSEWRHKC